jgi:hypothetical protein
LQPDNLNSFPSKALAWKKNKSQDAVAKMTAARMEHASVAAVVNADAAGKDHSFCLRGECWQEPDGGGLFQ